jgi:hypothetical protein
MNRDALDPPALEQWRALCRLNPATLAGIVNAASTPQFCDLLNNCRSTSFIGWLS